ncbi:MAG: hypothetical protein ACRDFS_13315 [Chloroflexota bacterium]
MEVDVQHAPADGETLVFTIGGAFSVKGSTESIISKLTSEEWPSFELSETGDKVVIRSDRVVAVRGGTRSRRANIGLTPTH